MKVSFIFGLWLMFPPGVAAEEPAYPPLLTGAKTVRELSADEADRGYPVRLTGIVTYAGPNLPYCFVQDETAGIYVNLGSQRIDFHRGARVELNGYSYSGRFAPCVRNAEFRMLGTGPLPPPAVESIDRLESGRFDSQWIETRGVVRSVLDRNEPRELVLEHRGFKTRARVPESMEKAALAALVDAAIRVRGVSSTRFGTRGRFESFQVLVPSAEEIVVEAPAPQNPYSIPVRSLDGLLRFTPQESDGHRIKIEGVVSFQRTGELLFVTDSTNSVAVRTRDTKEVRIGERVEVAGFPEMGECAPEIHDAIFRSVGAGAPPVAVSVSAEEAFSSDIHGHLIQTTGRLIDRTVRPNEQVLVLQSEGYTFPAMLETSKAGTDLDDPRVGSLLQVSGICVVELDADRNPRTVQIFLRDPEDVVVLRSPPWWTAKHFMAVFGGTVGITLLALAWGFLLRRRVEWQTKVIRERLEREMTLEQRYGELFENANDIVYTTDLEGVFTSINKAAERVLGYSRAELLGLNSLDLLGREHRDRASAMIRRKLDAGGETTYEVEILAKGGGRIPMELSTRLIFRGGEPFEVHGVARDLTERNRLEALLRQSQKMEAAGQVAAGLAHDFNNIMTVVQGHAGLLLSYETKTESKKSVTKILAASARAASLTRQLLSFCRKQSMHPCLLNLNEVIENAMDMLRDILGDPIAIELDLARDLPRFSGDAGMIDQVLVNLAVNARDAMPDGGRVSLITEAVDCDSQGRRLNPGADTASFVCLSIRDTGSGMGEETLSRVFEPFFTTKDVGKGTGLGLSIVYAIVKQHGGWVETTSEPNKGATFRIFFPGKDGESRETSRAAVISDPLPRGTETVLVVEDEEPVRHLVSHLLRRQGYRVLEAATGNQAIDIWKRENDGIEMLMTDVVMPGGMSGVDLAKRLKECAPNLKVLFTSGYYQDLDDSVVAFREGVDYLPKPYQPHKLAVTVRNCLDMADPIQGE